MYRKHLINRYIYTKYIGKDKQQVIIGRQLHQKIWCKSNTSFAYYYTLRCLSSKKKKKRPTKVNYRKNSSASEINSQQFIYPKVFVKLLLCVKHCSNKFISEQKVSFFQLVIYFNTTLCEFFIFHFFLVPILSILGFSVFPFPILDICMPLWILQPRIVSAGSQSTSNQMEEEGL